MSILRQFFLKWKARRTKKSHIINKIERKKRKRKKQTHKQQITSILVMWIVHEPKLHRECRCRQQLWFLRKKSFQCSNIDWVFPNSSLSFSLYIHSFIESNELIGCNGASHRGIFCLLMLLYCSRFGWCCCCCFVLMELTLFIASPLEIHRPVPMNYMSTKNTTILLRRTIDSLDKNTTATATATIMDYIASELWLVWAALC